MDAAELEHRFSYHAPDDSARRVHEGVRGMLGVIAQELNDILPEGREKALAITHLEETMFWANAAVARQKQ